MKSITWRKKEAAKIEHVLELDEKVRAGCEKGGENQKGRYLLQLELKLKEEGIDGKRGVGDEGDLRGGEKRRKG